MEGYAKVAQLMASQEEFAILRRFRVLNIQRLLFMQAELTHLESEIRQLAERDANHIDRQFFAKDWYSLSQATEEEDLEQWQKFLELNEKLEKYNDALLKQTSLARLEPPRSYDLEFLRSWFRRPGMGSFPLLGIDRDAWSAQNEGDLVAIKPRVVPDTFSKWFTESIVPRYHHLLGKRFKKSMPEDIGTGIYHYKESALETTLGTLTTVVASLLPICSIVSLYSVTSNGWRLGMIAIFSACFSLALAVMTSARRIEVFAATAAFAAVNVVFVTSNGPACPSSPCPAS